MNVTHFKYWIEPATDWASWVVAGLIVYLNLKETFKPKGNRDDG